MQDTEKIAKWMREVALQKNGYAILTDQDLANHHQRLVKIYYHAGRYAAGARDRVAVSAALEFEAVENADS